MHHGGLVAQRVEVGDQVAAHPVLVDQLVDLCLLVEHGRLAVDRVEVAPPLHGLIGDVQRAEHLVVEVVGSEQQVVYLPQEEARLGALDHPVVVGAGDGDELAHAEVGEQGGVGGLVLGGERQRAHAHDGALPEHQARHRLAGADGARVGDRDRDAAQVIGSHTVVAHLGDLLLVALHEGREVERVGVVDAGHHQRAGTVEPGEVHGEAQADVLGPHQAGPPVGVGGIGAVHERHGVGYGPHDGVADEVGERHLAAQLAAQVAVDDLAVDLEQLGRDVTEARGGRHGQAGLHVGHDAGADAADRLAAGRVVRGRVGRGRRCPARRRRRGGALAALEQSAPVGVHRGRIVQPAVPHLVDDPGVGAEGVPTLSEALPIHRVQS